MIAVEATDAGAGTAAAEHPARRMRGAKGPERPARYQRGVRSHLEVGGHDRERESTRQERGSKFASNRFDQPALERNAVEVEIGCAGRVCHSVESQPANVAGGEHGELGCPQVGVDLPGAVDPFVARLIPADGPGVADQGDDRVAVSEVGPGRPRIIRDQRAPHHVGVEEVQPGLHIVCTLVRIVGNRGRLGDLAGALPVEQIEVAGVCVGGAARTLCSAFGRARADVIRHRWRFGVGSAREPLQRIRPEVNRALLVREQSHGPRRSLTGVGPPYRAGAAPESIGGRWLSGMRRCTVAPPDDSRPADAGTDNERLAARRLCSRVGRTRRGPCLITSTRTRSA